MSLRANRSVFVPSLSRGNLRYLAFDLGEKRIGLAVSDELGITAQRLPVLEIKSQEETFTYIGELIKQYNISTFVVGLPRHMSGEIGKKGEEAMEFAKELENKFNLPVITWDERLTTVYANRSLRDMGIKVKKRRKIIDSVAAQLILQSYLNTTSID